MEMSYCEPPTSLFPHSHVNLVSKTWCKTDLLEHNTDCNDADGIINSFFPQAIRLLNSLMKTGL